MKLWLIPSKQISTNSYLKSNKDVKHWKDIDLVRKWNNNEDPLQLKNHSSVPIPKKKSLQEKVTIFYLQNIFMSRLSFVTSADA